MMAATQQSSCFCTAVSCRILFYATESSPPPQTGQDEMPVICAALQSGLGVLAPTPAQSRESRQPPVPCPSARGIAGAGDREMLLGRS